MPPEAKPLETVDLENQEIFATGLWNKDQYSEGDLDGMIDAFGKVGFKPPIKLGHSETQKLLKGEGLPAAGWVENLRRAGDKLICDFKRVPKKIADLLQAGAWRKKSAEVYWDYLDEANSAKFPRVLKAVSLLGEDIPAVTNLQDILALYKKSPNGLAHAYEEDGREFRVYCMPEVGMASQNPLDNYLLQFPRKSKEAVNYTDTDEATEERCGNCKFYIGYRSACTLIEGWIEQEYVCDYFEARPGVALMSGNGDVRKYTIEKRGDEYCLISGAGKVLGCHDSRAGAQAQEKAVQANKHSDEQAIAAYQNDPDRICGNLWSNGTESQRESFGDGAEGRERNEKPPAAWWDDCQAKTTVSKEEGAMMNVKVHMNREEIEKICPPCAEKMREKNISALKFSTEQVAKFAEMDMEKCMAKADMVEKYPNENDRKGACQKAMGEAMMDAVNETKGGPIMDEKKFEEQKAALEAEHKTREGEIKAQAKKEYDDKLAALEADKKKSEEELGSRIKKMERQAYDKDSEAWIAEEKKAGRLLPVEEPRIRAIFSELFEDGRIVQFSQDGKDAKESLADAIKTFIAKRPSIFQQMSHASPEPGEPMDNPGDELDRLAKEYQRKNNVKEYSAAFDAVRKENPELTQKWLALQQ